MYQIKKNGRVIEEHATLREATRAFWILTAHELKNDRVADYELDTYSSDCVDDPEKCSPPLPEWARAVLKEAMSIHER